MRKKIIWIVLGALLLVALVVLLWWWFLLRGPEAPQGAGNLGSSQDRPGQTTTQPSGPTNVGTPLPPGGTYIGGTSGSAGGTGGSSGLGSAGSGSGGSSGAPGVSWLGGAGGVFNPTPINQVDSGSVGGALPTIGGADGGGGSGSGLEGALIGAGLGVGLCTAGILGGATAGLISSAATAAITVKVDAPVQNIKDADELLERFKACITRYLARVALDQMTASIVQWINSGFDGKPSFVQNYEQFFSNVADQAAGEFIRGSALSFLCSPFQPQVRIAIAQSYARRNQAPSCSLQQVSGNINQFLSGNFASGGWRSLLSFTTVPTNNPYGAYMYGQNALNQAVQVAVNRNTLDITLGQGFLSQQKCEGPLNEQGKRGPPCKIVTLGDTINDSLATTLGTSYRQLELADNFDEIVSALVNQLMVRTLQNGLGSFNFNSAQASGNSQTQQAGQALLTTLQGAVSLAQQYGYAKQGSIGDIQNAQQQLQNLANCYAGSGNENGEDETLAKIAQLETRVGLYNNDIARANAAIAALQQLQTRVFSATTQAAIQTIENDFNAAQAGGSLITQANVTQAQQDRTALQSEMAALNQQTQNELNQCYGT